MVHLAHRHYQSSLCTGLKHSISPSPRAIKPWPQMPLLNLYLSVLFTKTAVSNQQIMVIRFPGTASGTDFLPCSLGLLFSGLSVLSCETVHVGKVTATELLTFSLWRNVAFNLQIIIQLVPQIQS